MFTLIKSMCEVIAEYEDEKVKAIYYNDIDGYGLASIYCKSFEELFEYPCRSKEAFIELIDLAQ